MSIEALSFLSKGREGEGKRGRRAFNLTSKGKKARKIYYYLFFRRQSQGWSDRGGRGGVTDVGEGRKKTCLYLLQEREVRILL